MSYDSDGQNLKMLRYIHSSLNNLVIISLNFQILFISVFNHLYKLFFEPTFIISQENT